MSRTCIHAADDAIRHPECASCRALLADDARRAELDDLANRDITATRWSAAPTPIEDVRAAHRHILPRSGACVRCRDRTSARLPNGEAMCWACYVAQGPDRAPLPVLDRDPTPEDIEAERDAPRPGVWAGEESADLRALTQDQTDMLIRAELVTSTWSRDNADAVARAVGYADAGSVKMMLLDAVPNRKRATCQRGGIDSDPLVRVLARRAWGDRDRAWFELRGVRKGDAVISFGARRRRNLVQRAWPSDPDGRPGTALADAAPGQLVPVEESTSPGPPRVHLCRVSDRLREPPVEQLDRPRLSLNQTDRDPVEEIAHAIRNQRRQLERREVASELRTVLERDLVELERALERSDEGSASAPRDRDAPP